MDELDKIITDALNADIHKPQSYTNMIRTTLDNLEKHNMVLKTKNMTYRIVTVLCVFLIMTTTIAFANNIYDFVYNIFNPATTGKGKINMIQQGYLYNVEMDYIKSKGNSIKIDYIIMDDFNLDLVFDMKTDEKIDNIFHLEILDLIIIDENKNLIFCTYNDEVYKDYCKRNKIEYDINWKDKNYSNRGYDVEILECNENNIKFIYRLHSEKYPKSKELNIQFREINIIPSARSVILNENNDKKIIGNWNLNIELPKQFYNREIITYKAANIQNDIIIENVEASYTEMHIYFKIKNDIDKIDNIQNLEEKFSDLLAEKKSNISIKNVIVENEKGKVFNISNESREGNFTKIFRKNGDLDVYVIFAIAKYDYTNIMYLKMNINEKEICVKLEK